MVITFLYCSRLTLLLNFLAIHKGSTRNQNAVMEAAPTLSIGIPVYNGARFLSQLLQNLHEQTFQDWEIVICDNASSDATPQISLHHAKADPRIRYYRNETNLGAIPNFHKVFTLCRAPLVKLVGHTDLYDPSYLEKCIKVLDENPDVVVAHAETLFVDERGNQLVADADGRFYTDQRTGARLRVDPAGMGESRYRTLRFADILFNSYCSHQIYGVFRRSVLERTGYIPNFYEGDKALLLRVALLGRFAQVRERLYCKRWHKNMSGAIPRGALRQWLDAGSRWYPWRMKKFIGFFLAPPGLPVPLSTKISCYLIVIGYILATLVLAALRRLGIVPNHNVAAVRALNNDQVHVGLPRIT